MVKPGRHTRATGPAEGVGNRIRSGWKVVLFGAMLWLSVCHIDANAAPIPPATGATRHPLAADAEDEPDDALELAAGLSMRYSLADRVLWQRSEPTPHLHPDFAPLTPLSASLNASEVERVDWTGLLLARPTGTFHLAVQAVGEVALLIDGAPVDLISQPGVRAGEATWYLTPPLELTGGLYPIQLHYTPPPRTATDHRSAAQLRLFWSSSHFPLEPLPADHLFHQRSAEAEPSTDSPTSRPPSRPRATGTAAASGWRDSAVLTATPSTESPPARMLPTSVRPPNI
jgi:hypothetical protein